jgi:hypothetical protein
VPAKAAAVTPEEPKEETPPEEPKYVPTNLPAKLAYITGKMAGIPKAGFNANQKYKFVRESDVAEKLSALLADQHVFLKQTVLSHSMIELYKAASGSTMWLTEVEVEFTWMDGDTGETLGPVVFPGHGADTGDKGIYKAMTGAEKYAIMKTFLVSTGDDPEADEKVDKAAAAAGAAAGPRVVRGNVEGAQRGGKSETVTEAQVKEMSRLTKEAGLTVTTLIPVVNTVLGTSLRSNLTAKQLHGALLLLSSEDGGKLISVLASGFAADVETDVEVSDNEPDPDEFSLV